MEGRSYTVCKACSAFNAPSLTVCHRCEAPLVHNQRQFERANVDIRGSATDVTGSIHEIDICNLGMGGLLFKSSRPYVEEDMLRLRIPLDGETFSVEAEVRHCQEDYQGYYIGAEFATTSPPFIFRVHELLKAASVS